MLRSQRPKRVLPDRVGDQHLHRIDKSSRQYIAEFSQLIHAHDFLTLMLEGRVVPEECLRLYSVSGRMAGQSQRVSDTRERRRPWSTATCSCCHFSLGDMAYILNSLLSTPDSKTIEVWWSSDFPVQINDLLPKLGIFDQTS